MRDVMDSLKQLVLADAGIMDLLAESDGPGIPPPTERVFVNLIPQDLIASVDTFHPPKMIVLRQAGGVAKGDLTALDLPTVDVLAYGEDNHQADRVRRAVWSRFTFLQRECVDDVMLHDINPAGGAIPSVEADTSWPAVAQSYTVTADVVDAA